MGLYYCRGVEYIIILKNKAEIIILNSCKTDERLLKTKYYKNLENTWFDNSYKYNWCVPIATSTRDKIEPINFEIILTDEEKQLIKEKLVEFNNDMEEHGWYDTNSISSTYEL
jgi:hypothetical protein